MTPPPGPNAGPPLTILLSATTKILGSDGKPTTLANGQIVNVMGKLDQIAKKVTADQIQILPAPPFKGEVSALKAGKSFTLTPPDDAQNAVPLTILLTASTKITGPDGKAIILSNDLPVCVTGDFAAATKTVTADQVRVQPPPPVQGVVQAVNLKTLSFTIAPPVGDGDDDGAPASLTVNTDSKTKIVKKGQNSNPDTKGAFSDLKAAECVVVDGTIARGTTVDAADEVDILPPPPSPK